MAIRYAQKNTADYDAQRDAIPAMRRRGMLTPLGEAWADRDLAEIRRARARATAVVVGGGP